jgi:hypothetical protein
LRDVPKRELRQQGRSKESGRIGSDIIRLDVFKRDLSLEDRRTRTVETHRAKIMRKVGVHSLAELVHYATRH